MILCLETSAQTCSVALTEGEETVFERVSDRDLAHSALLAVYVREAMQESGGKVDAVAVSSGPGSYTGLRIGVSLAKGLCFGLGIPLIAVPTSLIMASKAVALNGGGEAEVLYCAMIDARRMEVYATVYDADMNVVAPTKAVIITEDYCPAPKASRLCLFGSGAAKCKDVVKYEGAVFQDGIFPLATDMAALAAKAYVAGRFEDTAYFEPFYLKEFQATKPKNKIF